MHNLEHILSIAERRLRQASESESPATPEFLREMADAIGTLGGASHNYDPATFADGVSNSDDMLAEMNQDWSRRFLPPLPRMKKLYVMQNGEPDTLKIGTAYDPEARARGLQIGNHRPLTVVWTASSEDEDELEAEEWERKVHTILADRHIRGEWFRVSLDEAKAAINQARGMR